MEEAVVHKIRNKITRAKFGEKFRYGRLFG